MACQCPIRAFFNFYEKICFLSGWNNVGVNALYGPFLISTQDRSGRRKNNVRCQCPIRAFFNFYRKAMAMEYAAACVNALYGPFLISTELILSAKEYVQVSMPYTGLF